MEFYFHCLVLLIIVAPVVVITGVIVYDLLGGGK
jgi:hypothetical protein